MSVTTEEVRKVIADLVEWMEAAHRYAYAYACVVTDKECSSLSAYLGQRGWNEEVTDDRFADAAFRLRTRIAAEYRPEEGEAA